MHHAYYRTRDGRNDYRFEFVEQSNGTWRAYILEHPGYGGRSASSHATHRLSDSRGYYICWNRSLRSLEEAKQVAALWAECTQLYISGGVGF